MPTTLTEFTLDFTAKSTSQLTDLYKSIRSTHSAVVDQILATDTDKLTFANTFQAFHNAEGVAASQCSRFVIPGMTSEDKDIRSCANDLVKQLRTYWDQVYTRADLHAILTAAADGIDRSSLTAEQTRLIDRTLKEFLPVCTDDSSSTSQRCVKREDLERERELAQQIQVNIAEDSLSASLSSDDLAGCPADFVAGLPRDPQDESRYLVGTKAPHVVPVLKYADSAETREKVLRNRWSVAQEKNGPLLKDLAALRHAKAQSLGYASHGEWMVQLKMVESPEAIEKFLLEVYDHVHTSFKEDKKRLQAEKDRDLEDATSPLQAWDVAYYGRIAKERYLALDEQVFREYFPLENVISSVLKLYEEILGVAFDRVKEHPSIWHPDVRMYQVRSVTDRDSPVIGWFFLDLFPRDGKYTHQCVVPLQPAFVLQDESLGEGGVRYLPAAANIGNLTPPSPGRPALLTHREVQTFFHEFGHVMHCLCTQSQYTIFSWSWSIQPYKGGVEYDFLEAPSQMLENWIWDRSVLRRLSEHFEDPARVIPDSFLDSLVQSRTWMSGYDLSRQIMMSLYDLYLHTNKEGYSKDPQELYHELHEKFLELPRVEGTHYGASFQHLVQGYDVGYYGYLWSEVFSHDMFTVFNDCFDKKAGALYRQHILEPGATRNGYDMLSNLLGRKPSEKAFYDFLDSGAPVATEAKK